MIPVLIAYSTTEGHTAKVAQFMADALAGEGYRADLVDVGSTQAGLVQPLYAAAIVGGSVHMGRHAADLSRFLKANAEWLAAVPLAVFSVSLTAAREDAASRAAAQERIDDLLGGTGLVPVQSCRIAGALRFGEYGVVKRALARSAARDLGAAQGADVEFTDWDHVRQFAIAFVRDHDGAPRAVA